MLSMQDWLIMINVERDLELAKSQHRAALGVEEPPLWNLRALSRWFRWRRRSAAEGTPLPAADGAARPGGTLSHPAARPWDARGDQAT